MEINKEDCKHFYWVSQNISCCGRKSKDKKYGTCGIEQGKGLMCNTDRHYCSYEKKEDEDTSEL